MGRLDNKRAVITGAASGMGRAAAVRFAKEGAKVAILDINASAIDDVVKEITRSGGVAIGILCDTTNEESVSHAVSRTVDAFGGIDVCWANAGSGGEGTIVSTPLERWNEVLDLNLTGMYLTAKHVVPHMEAAGGGSLIFTSSSGVLSGTPNVASNMAAKGGVLGMTRQIALDYLSKHIRVNAICPGPIRTPTMIAAMHEREKQMGLPHDTLLAKYEASQPRGRIGEPDDVANLALFLASDESTWINAQFINVSGTGH